MSQNLIGCSYSIIQEYTGVAERDKQTVHFSKEVSITVMITKGQSRKEIQMGEDRGEAWRRENSRGGYMNSF